MVRFSIKFIKYWQVLTLGYETWNPHWAVVQLKFFIYIYRFVFGGLNPCYDYHFKYQWSSFKAILNGMKNVVGLKNIPDTITNKTLLPNKYWFWKKKLSIFNRARTIPVIPERMSIRMVELHFSSQRLIYSQKLVIIQGMTKCIKINHFVSQVNCSMWVWCY